LKYFKVFVNIRSYFLYWRLKNSASGITVKEWFVFLIFYIQDLVAVMVDRFYHATDVPAKIAVCMSGSGSNAEVLLEQAMRTGSPYQVAVIFTDAPESSRAIEIGEKFSVPVESLDIRKFYAEHGENDIKLDSDIRRKLRDMWSEKVWEIIAGYKCDFAVFAGFVPLTNLAEKLPCLNVHPGDLTVEKDGRRTYAGLHYKPVEQAILDGCENLRSSVISVQSFTGKNDVDQGPILGVSAPVSVELCGHTVSELQTVKDNRGKPPYKDILRSCAEKNIEKLKINGDHVVFPQVVKDFALGNYREDKDGILEYRNSDGAWQKVKTVEFSADGVPQVVTVEKPVAPAKKKRCRLYRFFKLMYTKIVRENATPNYIASGWALGMCVGCVIPIFCQLIISVPLSFVFRCSKIGAALGTFITTPPTAIFIYPIQIWVGNKLINGNISSDSARYLLEVFNSETLSFSEKWAAFADLGGELVAAFFAGGIVWAAIMTPLTYFGVRYLVVRYRKLRQAMLEAKRKKKAVLND